MSGTWTSGCKLNMRNIYFKYKKLTFSLNYRVKELSAVHGNNDFYKYMTNKTNQLLRQQ